MMYWAKARHQQWHRSIFGYALYNLYAKLVFVDYRHFCSVCGRVTERGAELTTGQDTGGTSPVSAEQIAERVLDAIASRRLPAGTKLGEDQLGRAFGVSRTVVRQALHRLAHVGVVTLIANRGAFIAEPSERQIADLYAARRVLEVAIVEEAAKYATSNDIRRLHQHVDQQRSARASGHRREYVRLLTEFHLVIADVGGNAILKELLSQLLPRTMLIFSLFERDEDDGCALDDHVALIKLIAAGDGPAAAALVSQHLSGGRLSPPKGAPAPAMVNVADALLAE